MNSSMDKFKILSGDARILLKDIESNSINCVITSPPYWGLRDYGHPDQIGLEARLPDYLKQLSIVFNEIFRVLKREGILWLIIGDGYTSGNRKYRAIDKKNPSRFLISRPDTPCGLKKKIC